MPTWRRSLECQIESERAFLLNDYLSASSSQGRSERAAEQINKNLSEANKQRLRFGRADRVIHWQIETSCGACDNKKRPQILRTVYEDIKCLMEMLDLTRLLHLLFWFHWDFPFFLKSIRNKVVCIRSFFYSCWFLVLQTRWPQSINHNHGINVPSSFGSRSSYTNAFHLNAKLFPFAGFSNDICADNEWHCEDESSRLIVLDKGHECDCGGNASFNRNGELPYDRIGVDIKPHHKIVTSINEYLFIWRAFMASFELWFDVVPIRLSFSYDIGRCKLHGTLDYYQL